jgi:hypothetical protein
MMPTPIRSFAPKTLLHEAAVKTAAAVPDLRKCRRVSRRDGFRFIFMQMEASYSEKLPRRNRKIALPSGFSIQYSVFIIQYSLFLPLFSRCSPMVTGLLILNTENGIRINWILDAEH